jgi:hypothetical protein
VPQIAGYREQFRVGLEPGLGDASGSAGVPDVAVRLDEALGKLEKLKHEKSVASSGLLFYKKFSTIAMV